MTNVLAIAWSRKVSGAYVALAYLGFGLTDMVLSLTAFMYGVQEANPFMAWLAVHNLFIPGKLLLTALVAVLIGWYYHRRPVQAVAWGALLLTAAVDIYHLWGLSVF
jgi:hypothetical protein